MSTVDGRVPALEISGIFVSFNGIHALDDVSFVVEPNTIHALIGPNGAGKTTCINTISGIYKPAAGSIRLAGTELVGVPPARIARLGVGRAFQNIVVSPSQTVRQTLLAGRYMHMRAGMIAAGLRLPWALREEARESSHVEGVAELLGLTELLDRPSGTLSYGDRKRLELGRALSMEPRLLLLDEPAAGLNDEETARIAQLIKDLCAASSMSVLIVEHDMSLVASLANHVTVLDFGRVLASGGVKETFENPKVIAAYLGAATNEEQP